MKKSYFTLIIFFTFFKGSASELHEEELWTAFGNLRVSETFKDEHRYVAKKQAISGDPSTAKTGLLSLSIIGEFEPIELVWWKSKDSDVRKLCVVLLLYKSTDYGVQKVLYENLMKQTSRFEADEKRKRQDELKDILENLKTHRTFCKHLGKLRKEFLEESKK